MTRPIIAIAVNAGLRGEVGDFPAVATASAISGLPPLSALLGFAVRTKAAFAMSGLLPRRLALNVAVDRRLDFVLLAFLAMRSPLGVFGGVLSPKKGAMRAQRCALALADREEEDRSDARTRETLWGIRSASLGRRTARGAEGSELIAHAAISCATTRPTLIIGECFS